MPSGVTLDSRKVKILTTKNDKNVAPFKIKFTENYSSSSYPFEKLTGNQETLVTYVDECESAGVVSFDSYTLKKMETSVLRPESKNDAAVPDLEQTLSEFTFQFSPSSSHPDSLFDQTICGEKTMSLAPNPNTFVSLSYTNIEKWIRVAPTLNSHTGNYP